MCVCVCAGDLVQGPVPGSGEGHVEGVDPRFLLLRADCKKQKVGNLQRRAGLPSVSMVTDKRSGK